MQFDEIRWYFLRRGIPEVSNHKWSGACPAGVPNVVNSCAATSYEDPGHHHILCLRPPSVISWDVRFSFQNARVDDIDGAITITSVDKDLSHWRVIALEYGNVFGFSRRHANRGQGDEEDVPEGD